MGQILNSATAAAMIEKFESDFQAMSTPDNSFYLSMKGSQGNAITVNVPQWLVDVSDLDATAEGSAASTTLWAEKSIAVTQKKFRSKALVISDWNEFFTSQSMRKDAMESLKAAMDTAIGNYVAYQLAKAATVSSSTDIIFTTGTTTRTTEVTGSNATVKKIVKADILAVKEAMGKTNLTGKWNCLITPTALSDLFEINEFVTANQLGEAQSRLLNGEFAEIMGIRFYQRSGRKNANFAFSQVKSPAANTLKDIYGVAGTADTIDNSYVGGVLFWNENAAYFNRGISKIYANEANALYQGDLISLQEGYGIEVIKTAGNTTSPVTNKPSGVIVLEEKLN